MADERLSALDVHGGVVGDGLELAVHDLFELVLKGYAKGQPERPPGVLPGLDLHRRAVELNRHGVALVTSVVCLMRTFLRRWIDSVHELSPRVVRGDSAAWTAAAACGTLCTESVKNNSTA